MNLFSFFELAGSSGPLLGTISSILTMFIIISCGALYLMAYERSRGRDGKLQSLGEMINEINLLEDKKKRIDDYINSFTEEMLKLKGEREEQERLRGELAAIQSEIAEKEGQREAIQQSLSALQESEVVYKRTQEELKNLELEIANLEKYREDASRAAGEKHKELELLVKKEADSRAALDRMNSEIATQKALASELAALQNQKGITESELAALHGKLASLRAEEHKIEEGKRLFENLSRGVVEQEIRLKNLSAEALAQENKRGRVERDLEELVETKAKLLIDIKKLKDDADKQKNQTNDSHAGSDGVFNSLAIIPRGLESAKSARMRAYEKEAEALETLRRKLKSDNFIFSDRIVNAFHTCLKISDVSSLTVLAGISGTGKTLLPLEYAKTMGMYSLVMSVQPRWDSPQDMLGFFNFVEKKYEATELAQALVAFDPYNFKNFTKISDGMLLVLLDEMNLARVEYYFSEFLSKLELRRTVPHSHTASDRALAEIVLDSGREGDSNRSGGERRLWISDRILFVGTMNEDESTQTLSDKVLDRANVIRFGAPKPKDKVSNPASAGSENKLSEKTWKSWRCDQFSDSSAEYSVRSWCKGLNEFLEKAGRPIGYRIQDSVLAYVRNYPEGRWREAFADQLEYKIIPKLRGLPVGEPDFDGVMNKIFEIVSELKDEQFLIALDTAKERSKASGSGTFIWQGISRNG